MSTPTQRLAMAKEIVNLEARRDHAGNLDIYRLPSDDGGGRYEVAGINEKYNPTQAARLRDMILSGQYVAAENYAVDFIANDTDSAATLTRIPAVESYLRDCVFNRGATGAVRILQHAVEADVDGDVGDETRKNVADAEKDPEEFLKALRNAREWYERSKYVGYRANLWQGMLNRFDNALVIARKFPMVPQPANAPSDKAPDGKSWLTALGALFLQFIEWLSSRNASGPSPPATTPAKVNGPVWMLWAQKEVGFHEIGVNRGIEKYITLSKNGTLAELLGEPWCADFSNAALEASGIRGTRSAMARSYEDSPYFVPLNGPSYGCIVTKWRGSRGSGLGHVFFYLGENEHGVFGLGGNQSDSVSREYHAKDHIVGYYWPKSVPLPVTGAVTIAFGGETKGTET